jgi:hypothetical protein
MTSRKIPKFSILCLSISILASWSYAYYDKTHQKAALAAIELLLRTDQGRPLRLYEDFSFVPYKESLVRGASDEDYGVVGGNDRSLRHYFDPITNKGVGWYPYYLLWPELEPGSQASIPANLSHPLTWTYPTALDWAMFGAGSGDLRNWEGAIDAYDETESSRREAYWRLGHVLHLLADMAEPDHATDTPHAGSGFTLPGDYEKILRLVKYIPGFDDKGSSTQEKIQVLLNLYGGMTRTYVGFERLIEDNPPPISGQNVRKYRHPTVLFKMMAEASRQALIQGSFMLPLGCVYWPGESQVGKSEIKDYSFFPAIDRSEPHQVAAFRELSRRLLDQSAEYGAGLLEQFHDFVDPPPYVRRVVVRQGGWPRYVAEWISIRERIAGTHINEGNPKFTHSYSYEIVTRRELKVHKNEPIEAGKPASMRIEFGPSCPEAPERIRNGSVEVLVRGESVPGNLTADLTTWDGRFTPTLDSVEEEVQSIHISARDVHNHRLAPKSTSGPETLASGPEWTDGYLLDSHPETPAKGYSTVRNVILGYQQGSDYNHTLVIKERPDTDEGASYTDSKGKKVFVPCGKRAFADRVMNFKVGNPAPVPSAVDSSRALGEPDFDPAADTGYVTLGCGGQIILEFAKVRLVDIAGPDLYVFEIGPDVEATDLEIRSDEGPWIRVGSISGGKAQVDIAVPGVSRNDRFRYVRLTDKRTACHGDWPGADIDAIAALGCVIIKK